MRSMFAIALALTIATGSAHAEIEPKYYAQSQTRAPDAVTIEVVSASASICWFNACDAREVVVKATVKAVERSKSGLKPGQSITIRYKSVNMDGRSGPRPIPVLVEGRTYPAFLRQDGADYRPAARGASFQPQIVPR